MATVSFASLLLSIIELLVCISHKALDAHQRTPLGLAVLEQRYSKQQDPQRCFSQKHLRCLRSRLVASAAEERDKACVVGDGKWM